MGKRKANDDANLDNTFSENAIAEGKKLEPKESENSKEPTEYYIDESGFLVNPSLIETEQRKSRDERLGTVPLPKLMRKKKSSEFIKLKPNSVTKQNKVKKKKKKRSAASSRENTKPVTWNDVVKCPICGVGRIYGELFTHVVISHPKENAKIVLDKFNRLHGIGKYKNQP